jgi:protein O-GlcNAc transferase
MAGSPLDSARAHFAGGRFDQAERVLRPLVQRQQNPEALLLLGLTLFQLRKDDQALHFVERAAAAAPGWAEAWATLGDVSVASGHFGKAEAALRKAVAIEPHERALVLLADLPMLLGRPEEGAAATLETRRRLPGNFLHWATRAAATCYASDVTPEERAAEHRAVGEAVARMPPLGLPPLSVDRDPERALRVAYLSPDFSMHVVSYFFEPILERTDRARYTPYCYYGATKRDAMSVRLREMTGAQRWRDVPPGDWGRAGAMMRADRIDIAVELAGLTASSLVWVLRERVAPVHVTYLGYPHSTGLATIDYRVVDSLTDPPGRADALASEKLARIDPCFLCFKSPVDPPAVLPGPTSRGGALAFGSFNRIGKVSARARRVWARVLEETPGSRLVVKNPLFLWKEGRARYLETLRESGIDPARVELLAKTDERQEHLGAYAKVDIALDPFPYNGTTTTIEAMLMGVPVVVLAGESHHSRVGVSILTSVGLTELIAASEDEYVAIASRLARDPERLARLRGELRVRVLESPLCDARAFAARWDGALRGMWRTFCAAMS